MGDWIKENKFEAGLLLAVVVVVDDPANGKYYGGDVAAPVFSKIIADSARILAIPPDDLGSLSKPLTVALQ